jgi:hypothetical protein
MIEAGGAIKNIAHMGARALTFNFKELAQNIGAFKALSKQQLLKAVRTTPQLLSTMGMDAVSRMFANRITAAIESIMLQKSIQFTNGGKLDFDNWVEAVVTYEGQSGKLFELGLSSNGGFAKFTQEIGIEATLLERQVASIENMRYLDNATNTIKEANFKVLYDPSTKAFRIIKVFDEAVAFTQFIAPLKAGLGYKPIMNLDFTGFKAEPNDAFFDVIIHYDNGAFVITKEGSFGRKLSIEELANIIADVPVNKTVRLLSCNSMEAAKKLSTKTTRPFYASDGWVDLYKDGRIRSENNFYKFERGEQKFADKIEKNTSEITDVQKITLGTKAGSSSVVGTLKKLINKSSSESITWKNLDDTEVIWTNPSINILSTAKSFANEKGTSLYDVVLTNGYYVKFDINDGRILLGKTDGTYHAFAVINDADLNTFKSSFLTASENVFNSKLTEFLTINANKLKIISGVVSKQLNIAGTLTTLSTSKVNTMLGRFRPDVANLFEELGSFKNVGLGETKGGINILNKPDYYYDAASWWSAYNKPWLDKAIQRGDDIRLATIPTKAEDIIDASGNLKGAFAQELDHIATKNYKPVNITDAIWFDIKYWLGKSYVHNGARLNQSTVKNAFNTHVKVVEDVSKEGVSGGHTIDAFKEVALPNIGKRIEIISETQKPGVPGVTDIEYKVLALDGRAEVISGQYIQKSGQDRIFKKTVYDKAAFTDEAMEELGKKAFKDAMDRNAFDETDRSFKGIVNGQNIAGHYEFLNGEKVLRSWWID